MYHSIRGVRADRQNRPTATLVRVSVQGGTPTLPGSEKKSHDGAGGQGGGQGFPVIGQGWSGENRTTGRLVRGTSGRKPTSIGGGVGVGDGGWTGDANEESLSDSRGVEESKYERETGHE